MSHDQGHSTTRFGGLGRNGSTQIKLSGIVEWSNYMFSSSELKQEKIQSKCLRLFKLITKLSKFKVWWFKFVLPNFSTMKYLKSKLG
jgi:hypothetical protein